MEVNNMKNLKQSYKASEWEDWRWQMKNTISNLSQLEKFLRLSVEEKQELQKIVSIFPLQITPYYANLIDPEDQNDPIRKQIIPDVREIKEMQFLAASNQKTLDDYVSGLSREGRIGGWDNPEDFIDKAKTVERKYPNRVAWLITRTCPAWCRHCVRRVMSEETIVHKLSPENIELAIQAISREEAINDVLITGGDAFMIPTEIIDEVSSRLLKIDHITSIRFGTRTIKAGARRFQAQQTRLGYDPI